MLAVLLVLGVGAGPALLDPCLVGCHEPAGQAAVPACHESTDAAGLSMAGTADCGHDHTGIEADSPLESRLTTARQVLQAMVLPEAPASAHAPLPGGRMATRPASDLQPHVSRRPQLRV